MPTWLGQRLTFLTRCHFFLLSLFFERHTVHLGASTLFTENPGGRWGLGDTRQRPGWGRSPS